MVCLQSNKQRLLLLLLLLLTSLLATGINSMHVCGFVQRRNPDSVREMRNWNMQFSPNLLQIQARQLQPEMLYQTADRRNSVSRRLF